MQGRNSSFSEQSAVGFVVGEKSMSTGEARARCIASSTSKENILCGIAGQQRRVLVLNRLIAEYMRRIRIPNNRNQQEELPNRNGSRSKEAAKENSNEHDANERVTLVCGLLLRHRHSANESYFHIRRGERAFYMYRACYDN